MLVGPKSYCIAIAVIALVLELTESISLKSTLMCWPSAEMVVLLPVRMRQTSAL